MTNSKSIHSHIYSPTNVWPSSVTLTLSLHKGNMGTAHYFVKMKNFSKTWRNSFAWYMIYRVETMETGRQMDAIKPYHYSLVHPTHVFLNVCIHAFLAEINLSFNTFTSNGHVVVCLYFHLNTHVFLNVCLAEINLSINTFTSNGSKDIQLPVSTRSKLNIFIGLLALDLYNIYLSKFLSFDRIYKPLSRNSVLKIAQN